MSQVSPPTNQPLEPAIPPESGAQPTSYAKVAGRGLLLTLASFMVNKGFTLGAQLVLAAMLSEYDFGVVGLATAISMYVQTFRDGGVREMLVQRSDRYEELEGQFFWLSTAMNFAVALVLGLAGGICAYIYVERGKLHEASELSTLVWIMAAALPLGSATTVLHAKLRIDLRFKALAWFTILSGIVRYGGQIALALMGWGPMSIVIPTVLVAAVESVFCIVATGRHPWAGPAHVKRWYGTLRQTIWLILGSAATGVSNFGYILLIGLFLSIEETGVYTWTVLILMQIETLVAQSVVTVLFPVLARLQHEPQRQGAAAIRVVRACALVVSPMAITLAACFPALNELLFNGKWAAATVPMTILALFYPLRTVFVTVPHALLQSQGRFRAWFMLWFTNVIGLLCISALGAWIFGTTAGVAWCVGAFLGINCLWSTARVLKPLGIARRETVRSALTAPLIGIIAGGLAIYVDRAIVAPWCSVHITDSVRVIGHSFSLAQIARVAFAATISLGVYGVAIRALAAHQMHEALSILPQRLSKPISSLLRLR